MRAIGAVRTALAFLFLIVLGVFAIRAAIVAAYPDQEPSLAESLWPGHPEVLREISMAEVGAAAARGSAPSAETLQLLHEVAEKAPLAPEPFLVRGAIADREGQHRSAERLLLAAKERAPRVVATRYLLADLYLRQNRMKPALNELAALTRLLPEFSRPIGPALAQYAQTPGAAAHLRQVLGENPQLENLVLSELAADARNADLILSLTKDQRTADKPPSWQQRLVSAMVEAGEYDRAYQLSRRFGFEGVADEDFAFRRTSAQSPFSWTFVQQSAGTAEPVDGRLDVVFSGATGLTLASRIGRLRPGQYVLRMKIAGDAPESVRWSVSCLPAERALLEIPLSRARSGVLASRFRIPPECPAQRFQLEGQAETFPATSVFSVVGLDVNQVGR